MALGKRVSTWTGGRWHDGNVAVLGAADHGAWQGTLVFDGARAFEGVTPDLDLHCARILRSAAVMGLDAPMEADEIEAIVREGLKRYPPDAELYLRPMMWSRDGGPAIIDPQPDSTSIAICIEDLPMARPGPFSLSVSPFRRPQPDMALTEAKAACLYANNGRIAREAQMRGFNNALSLDAEGHVAETASTNAFLVRGGVVSTPVPNGTFLNGITRQRVIALLRADGVEVREETLDIADFAAADEIFLTGNASKVTPVTRFEDRDLGEGRMAARARRLYWDYAHQTRIAA
jgi:branched-chain amino acid aminotransferase